MAIPGFFSKDTANALKERALKLLREFDLSTHPKTKFSTGSKSAHVGDDYFLNSGDKIRFFFEEDALDDQSCLKVDKEASINKIGHGLHIQDELFHEFTATPDLKGIARSIGFKIPHCLQSMVICKQPKIGGEVPPHQDSTFLYTNPTSAVGFWFALEDCTPENGCMWFAPGSHKTTPVTKRFVRLPQGGTGFIHMDNTEQQSNDHTEFQCVPTPAGNLLFYIIPHHKNNSSYTTSFITSCLIQQEHLY